MRLQHVFLIGLLFTGFTAPSFAAAFKYSIDPLHVWVNFSIQQNIWSKALGRFTGVTGNIVFDRLNVEDSSVTAEIDANTAETGEPGRDREVRYQFLQALRFPKILFASTHVERTGDATGLVTGDLTIGNVTLPVTMDVTYNGSAMGPFSGLMTLGFSAKGSLSIVDFQIPEVAPTMYLGPAVDFVIEVQAVKD